MQELNATVQSGGERAVATAAFMLALQESTPVPFRCVDEINQGKKNTVVQFNDGNFKVILHAFQLLFRIIQSHDFGACVSTLSRFSSVFLENPKYAFVLRVTIKSDTERFLFWIGLFCTVNFLLLSF